MPRCAKYDHYQGYIRTKSMTTSLYNLQKKPYFDFPFVESNAMPAFALAVVLCAPLAVCRGFLVPKGHSLKTHRPLTMIGSCLQPGLRRQHQKWRCKKVHRLMRIPCVQCTHRPLSSSVYGLYIESYKVIPKKELLRGPVGNYDI